MAIAKELALDQEQFDAILSTEWNIRIATLGPGARINVTPMWFGWAGGKIYTFGRGQKVINLRKNTNCTVLVVTANQPWIIHNLSHPALEAQRDGGLSLLQSQS